jgi:hypothetical protein
MPVPNPRNPRAASRRDFSEGDKKKQRRRPCVLEFTHGEQSALRTHRTPDAAASTASHPAFPNDRDTPLVWDETGGLIKVIWVRVEAEYFCERGWTGNCLPGKSLPVTLGSLPFAVDFCYGSIDRPLLVTIRRSLLN